MFLSYWLCLEDSCDWDPRFRNMMHSCLIWDVIMIMNVCMSSWISLGLVHWCSSLVHCGLALAGEGAAVPAYMGHQFLDCAVCMNVCITVTLQYIIYMYNSLWLGFSMIHLHSTVSGGVTVCVENTALNTGHLCTTKNQLCCFMHFCCWVKTINKECQHLPRMWNEEKGAGSFKNKWDPKVSVPAC